MPELLIGPLHSLVRDEVNRKICCRSTVSPEMSGSRRVQLPDGLNSKAQLVADWEVSNIETLIIVLIFDE